MAFLAFFLLFFLQLGIVFSSRFYSGDVSCQRGMIISGNETSCPEGVSAYSESELPEETTSKIIPSVLVIIVVVVLYVLFNLFHRFNKRYFKKKVKK